MNQQIINLDGRRFLVETHEHQTVTELDGHQRGREVTGLLAAEAIALAEEIQANRPIQEWPTTDVSEVLYARFELATEWPDAVARMAFAFAVQQLLADPKLMEDLDREQARGEAA